MSTENQSPFERRAYAYIERGYSVIPIAPGTKRPGQWSAADGWRGMHDWERFGQRLPTELELESWYRWPGAGIGLLCGKQSQVVALDRDYDTNGTDALDAIIPYTPVKKKGAKGWTGFYRYNGERSCSFNINEIRVLDVLSDGRQTLMPGTIHPDGHTYIYLTEDILEDFDPEQLPMLPADFLAQVEQVLLPYQTDHDRRYQKKTLALQSDAAPINTDLSTQAQYFRDLNHQALARLDEWVPRTIETARAERDGYRCVATWRGASNPNVGINPKGIFDFGGNYGMTPIDLVMYANGLTFGKAAEALRACLPLNEPEPIMMTVGKPVAPTLMPWQKPPATTVSAPPTIMLPPDTSLSPAPAIPAFILNAPGILGETARWITASAPKAQPELSLTAAIALCSVVMGRTYVSQFGNYTSLYLVMIAKSTEGKEHPQACVEKVLTAAGLTELIGGAGYTSAGAVYSALLKSPCHIVTIDELGKLLKLSRAQGQSHTEAAIDKLVEAFGRLGGIMRPPTYSDMTMRQKIAIPIVHQPAITLLGATTPATFYGALTSDLVHDGFLGRCIVIESKQPRQLTRFVERSDPPPRIVEWAKAVHVTGVLGGDLVGVIMPDQPAHTIQLPFAEGCLPILEALEARLNDEKTATENEGLDVLLGRTQEKAMRLAMLAAKAENPSAQEIAPWLLEWAIEYVMYYDSALIRAVRENRTESVVDADIQRLVKFVKNTRKYAGDAKWGSIMSQGAMPHSKLLKMMKCSAKQMAELVSTAVEAGYITRSPLAAFGGAGLGDCYLPAV